MDLKDLWKWLLALFGFGGVAVLATTAWGVPQTAVYSQLLPAPQWLYAGDTASCIWEVHPNTTKTINSVSYGVPGSWTACTQNTSDKLLWTCSSVTVAEGNVTCPGIRIVQNEFPGTTETLDTENLTFKTASVKGTRFPGCTSADCTITSGASIPVGNYFMRNLKIDAAMTFAGNTNITAVENFTIGSSGSISFGSGSPITLNITTYRFNNSGAISGNGNTGQAAGAGCTGTNDCGGCSTQATVGIQGGTLILNAMAVTSSGTISLNGGNGGAGATCCQGTSPWYGGWCPAFPGGAGGTLKINPRAVVNITGAVSVTGGIGGAGSSTCCGGYCSAPAADGGVGGSIIFNSTNFSTSATVTSQGGSGGAAACCSICTGCGSGQFRSGYAGNGGTGGTSNYSAAWNITVTNTCTATGGAAGAGAGGCPAGSVGTTGANNAFYCGNGTGMNWANFNPAATQSIVGCLSPPSVSFVVPNSTSNFTSYLQNISVNSTRPDNITLILSFSKDNGSTWEWLSPDFYSLPFNASNNNTPYLDTHRQGTDNANYAVMRVIAYNNSSGIYGDPVEIRFNLTDMATTVIGSAVPNGTISTNTILFTCNYTNSSGYMLEAATPYLVLDGSSYAMSFNDTSKLYYWNNDQVLLAGNHTWNCQVDKANYKIATSANVTFNITGFGIFLPTGVSSVKLTCPFPTITGMTPAGQKAGIGIFRIVNYNSSATHNYSLFLNNTPPSGTTVYARCDRFSPNLAGWTTLSTTTGYKGLLNIASTNASAYCWLRMDCASATPGTYTPIDYVFTEE